uniref:EF-hand domain-containing protein n=1 Tax=Chromera velia CCMP2878 TaxID=1169474 RepID=A0A0K6S6P1_9ALVE|eukprot:Cvel_18017.t1-p1 / transcript=Cvel_18017.t1 / gene=Cvel_18017 / organism=Chromera_velia_CCMP2878 / gene_product=hypothetical protein / transcript_product=hypothetical protein / location=Cvel_scaffold1470:3622-18231(-) / protein_length=628 / sequence_SO=supercontig / SO=protein_coding / is_pseudo=false
MLSETLVSDDLSPSVASGDQTTHLPSSSGKVRLPSLMKSPTSPSFKHAVSPPSHERVVTPPTMREGDLPSPVEKEKPRLPARRASVSDPSILPSPLNLTGTEEGGRIAPMSSSALRTRRKSRAGGALLPNSASAASTLRKGALSPGGSSPKKEKLPGRNRRMSVEVGPAALRLLGDDEAKVAAMISGDYEKTAEEEAIDKEAFVLLLRKVAPGATQPQYYRIWNILAKKSKPKKKAVSTGLEKDRPGVTFQMLDAELSLALRVRALQLTEEFREKITELYGSTSAGLRALGMEEDRDVPYAEFIDIMTSHGLEYEAARRIFLALDAEAQGFVDSGRIRQLVRLASPSVTLDRIRKMLIANFKKVMDAFTIIRNAEGGGGLSREEFDAGMSLLNVPQSESRMLFAGLHVIDADGSGDVDRFELQAAMRAFAPSHALKDFVMLLRNDIIFQLLDSKMEGKITLAHLVNTIYPDAEPVIHRKFRRASMVARVRRASMQIDKELQPLKDELRKLKMELAAGIQRVHKAAINGGVGGRRETVRVSTPPLVRASFDKQKRLHNVAERTMAETCPQVAQGDYISKALRTKVQEYFRLREKVLEAALEVKIDERPDMLEVFEDHKFHITPTFMGEN